MDKTLNLFVFCGKILFFNNNKFLSILNFWESISFLRKIKYDFFNIYIYNIPQIKNYEYFENKYQRIKYKTMLTKLTEERIIIKLINDYCNLIDKPVEIINLTNYSIDRRKNQYKTLKKVCLNILNSNENSRY
jgi:hypothetical protein